MTEINLINIEIICYDPNIPGSGNSYHFYGCYPSYILITTIKNKINEIWSGIIRRENYILKMDDKIINEYQSISQNKITNNTKLYIDQEYIYYS